MPFAMRSTRAGCENGGTAEAAAFLEPQMNADGAACKAFGSGPPQLLIKDFMELHLRTELSTTHEQSASSAFICGS